MSFKQGSVTDINIGRKLIKIKNESYEKIRAYYEGELEKHEEEYSSKEWRELINEYENIDLNDPAVYYNMMGNTNKPVYEYFEKLSSYYKKKYFLTDKIAQVNKIGERTGGVDNEKLHDELLMESYKQNSRGFLNIMEADAPNRVDKNIRGEQTICYMTIVKEYYSYSLNIPHDSNSLRDAMVSFQFGDFSAFIGISGEWDATINYIDKKGSLQPIHYSEKHMFY